MQRLPSTMRIPSATDIHRSTQASPELSGNGGWGMRGQNNLYHQSAVTSTQSISNANSAFTPVDVGAAVLFMPDLISVLGKMSPYSIGNSAIRNMTTRVPPSKFIADSTAYAVTCVLGPAAHYIADFRNALCEDLFTNIPIMNIRIHVSIDTTSGVGNLDVSVLLADRAS